MMLLANLISYAVQVGVLLIAGLVAPRLLGLRSPVFSLRYWQLLLAAVLLLPLIQPWHDPALGTVTVQGVGVMVTESVATAVHDGVPASIIAWLAVGVAGVAVLRLAWIGFGLWSLIRARRLARPIEGLPRPVTAIRDRLAVSAELRESNHIRVPVTFGWWRPTVLLPSGFDRLPEAQQTGVVCHELLHIRRGDWLIGVAERLLLAVLWFHPAVSLLLARIALSREQLVDAEVVRITGNRRSYLDALWSIARRGVPPVTRPVLPLLNRSDLLQRVAVLTEEVTMTRTRMLAAAAAVVTSVAVAGVAAAAAFPLVKSSPPDIAGSTASIGAEAADTDPKTKAFRYEEDGEITEPKIIRKVNPKYPEEAREARLTGVVVCESVITKTGDVADVKIVRSADEVFNQPTIDALKQWKFEPATLDGEPVDVYYVLTFKYNLSKDKPKSDEDDS